MLSIACVVAWVPALWDVWLLISYQNGHRMGRGGSAMSLDADHVADIANYHCEAA